MKSVAIVGMDTFAPKNLLQLDALNSEDYIFDIFVTDKRGSSRKIAAKAKQPHLNECYILNKGVFSRLLQVACYFSSARKTLDHIEIYPGGRFALFYPILARIFGIKTLVVERGDLTDYFHYPCLVRLSMNVCYRMADFIWFKEPYMEPLLKGFGARNLEFIHNAVPIPQETNSSPHKTYDFLWVNRLIAQRHSDWFVNTLKEEGFKHTQNAMLGFQEGDLQDDRVRKNQGYVQTQRLHNLDLLSFVDPSPFYRDSKFFILPADIVFCNYSLIESMSYGVVPIISDVGSADLIVTDGIDGFISPNTYEGFRDTMAKVRDLPPGEYTEMSKNAARKVKEKFGLEPWKNKLLDLYRKLHN